MKRRIHLSFIILFILSLYSYPQKLLAAPYYAGKTLVITVGAEPGGGYDRYARLLSKHLPKHIPGNPKIIVTNMPGAGGAIQANYMYSIAKPDGYTIGGIQRGLALGQLLKVAGMRFDLRKFGWIGTPVSENTVLALRSDLPYKSIDDLRKAKDPLHLASVSMSTSDYQFPILLKEFFSGLRL